MVDIMANKNILSDSHFETVIYPKLISRIKSYPKFQELDKIVTEKGFQVVFYHCKEETKREINYEVGFDICDKQGKPVSVLSTAPIKYYDLGELSSSPCGTCCSKTTKKLRIYEDDNELFENCSVIIEYLMDLY